MLKPVSHVGLDGSFKHDFRTEDVKFSPSGSILGAVATSGQVFLFSVDTSVRPVRINRFTELHSSSLASPHGIDFLSDDTIVVANRSGWGTFYRLPAAWGDRMTLDPDHEMDSVWFGRKGTTRDIHGRAVVCGPGAVRVSG